MGYCSRKLLRKESETLCSHQNGHMVNGPSYFFEYYLSTCS